MGSSRDTSASPRAFPHGLSQVGGPDSKPNKSEHILWCLSRQGIHLHDKLSIYFPLTWTWGVSLEPCLDGAPESVAGKDTLMTLDRLGSTLVLPDSHYLQKPLPRNFLCGAPVQHDTRGAAQHQHRDTWHMPEVTESVYMTLNLREKTTTSSLYNTHSPAQSVGREKDKTTETKPKKQKQLGRHLCQSSMESCCKQKVLLAACLHSGCQLWRSSSEPGTCELSHWEVDIRVLCQSECIALKTWKETVVENVAIITNPICIKMQTTTCSYNSPLQFTSRYLHINCKCKTMVLAVYY